MDPHAASPNQHAMVDLSRLLFRSTFVDGLHGSYFSESL
jgi:hypothetical protein